MNVCISIMGLYANYGCIEVRRETARAHVTLYKESKVTELFLEVYLISLPYGREIIKSLTLVEIHELEQDELRQMMS